MATTKTPKASKTEKAKERTFVQSLPTNLSHSRSLNPALFVMSATNQDDPLNEVPVTIQQHDGRGTQSQPMLDPHAALEAASKNPATANPFSVECARLPHDRDTLVVRGSVRVVGATQEPEACSGVEYLKTQKEFLSKFSSRGGFDQLAERYLMNIINGRWLFRNRLSPKVSVSVAIGEVRETFDANAIQGGYSLSIADLPAEKQEKARALSALVAKALQGTMPTDVIFVEITAKVLLGVNAEVYPSQPFMEKESKKSREDRSPTRILASVTLGNGVRQAVMHDQKVGNGIRTIDTWYSESALAIPVEAYGSVPRRQRAERLEVEGAKTFYDLQSALPSLVENMEAEWNNALFFAAMLVRGGVFGRKSTEKKDTPKDGSPEATADAGVEA